MRLNTLVLLSLLASCLPGWAQDLAKDPESLALRDPEYLALRVRQLVETLQTAREPGKRSSAAGWLATIGPPAKSALPALAKALHDPDEDVRYRSVHAIVAVGPDESAIPDLVWAARDVPDSPRASSISAAAIDALVRIGEPAIPSLIGLLGVPPEEGTPGSYWTGSDVTARALATFGKRVIHDLIVALDDERLRAGAAVALEQFGPEAACAVPRLVKYANDPSPAVRYRVAKALGAIGPAARDAVPVLKSIVGSKQFLELGWYSGAAAIEALGRIGPDAAPAVPELVGILRDIREYVPGGERVVILDALGAIGPAASSTLPEIRALLSHRDPVTRSAAQAAIAKIESAAPSDPSAKKDAP